jgi:hypothetical protein
LPRWTVADAAAGVDAAVAGQCPVLISLNTALALDALARPCAPSYTIGRPHPILYRQERPQIGHVIYPPENNMKTIPSVLIGGLMALSLAACSSTGTGGSAMSGSASSGSSMSAGSTHTGSTTAASDNGADNNAGAGASNNATNTGTPTAPSTATSTSGGANR